MLPYVRALRAVLVFGVACGVPAAAIGATATSAGASYKGCNTAISSSTLVPGEHATVEGDDDCFEHDSPVNVGLGPTTTLGSFASTKSGSVTAGVTIPAGARLGPSTITLNGPDPAGVATTYSIPVTIVAALTSSSGSRAGALAFTGHDEGILIGIGAALMAVGVGVTAATRRRRRARMIG